MDEYIGLDVSLKDTAISIRRDGKRTWRGKCPSDPRLLAEVSLVVQPRDKRPPNFSLPTPVAERACQASRD
jgi:hypothetical protein